MSQYVVLTTGRRLRRMVPTAWFLSKTWLRGCRLGASVVFEIPQHVLNAPMDRRRRVLAAAALKEPLQIRSPNQDSSTGNWLRIGESGLQPSADGVHGHARRASRILPCEKFGRVHHRWTGSACRFGKRTRRSRSTSSGRNRRCPFRSRGTGGMRPLFSKSRKESGLQPSRRATALIRIAYPLLSLWNIRGTIGA